MFKVSEEILKDSRSIIDSLLQRLFELEQDSSEKLIKRAEKHIELLDNNYLCPEE